MMTIDPPANELDCAANPHASTGHRLPHPAPGAASKVASVASEFADSVDLEARFPIESVAALREQRLLSAAIPREMGGESATLREIAKVCRMLGSSCASTAMIYAMHHAQIYCLVKHMKDDVWFRTFFQDMAREQWLLASATSEDTIGGDVRSSVCAVMANASGEFTLSKRATTISYGAYADAILATARRNVDAAAADQVLVMLKREDLSLQPTSVWNTLGMRGTCSGGFMLEGRGHVQQVFQTPFSEIADRTILAVSHVLWSSVWLGIATDAVRRGQKYFRKQVRLESGAATQSSMRLTNALGMLRTMEATIDAATQCHEQEMDAESQALLSRSALRMNDLKIRMSNMALDIVREVMQLCGMAAYKNDTPFSLGRHLRDLHSAPIMINNDRLAGNMAVLMMAERAI